MGTNIGVIQTVLYCFLIVYYYAEIYLLVLQKSASIILIEREFDLMMQALFL
jgi:hypothetical protein